MCCVLKELGKWAARPLVFLPYGSIWGVSTFCASAITRISRSCFHTAAPRLGTLNMPLSQKLSMPLGPRAPTKPEQTCAFSYLGPGLSPTLTPREWGQLYSYPDLVPLLVFSASFPETTCLSAFFLTSNKYLLSTNKMRGSVL